MSVIFIHSQCIYELKKNYVSSFFSNKSKCTLTCVSQYEYKDYISKNLEYIFYLNFYFLNHGYSYMSVTHKHLSVVKNF